MQTKLFRRNTSWLIQTSGYMPISITIALSLIMLADFLFYQHVAGVSLVFFLIALAFAALLANRLRATRRERQLAAAVLVFSLYPAVEAVSPLSVLISIGGVALFALIMTGNGRVSPWVLVRRIATVLTADLARSERYYERWRRSRRVGDLANLSAACGAWLTPIALGTVFVAIFSLANPLFWSWVSLLDPRMLFASVEPWRLLFWLLSGIFVSAFVRMPAFARARRQRMDIDLVPQSWSVGTAFVVRSLIIFNAIFALQTVLDAVYLWGGVELPVGVSPAANAQKAAYLLVVSALLAAAFVLVATRDVAARPAPRLVRKLVYFWVAQNVVLVLSAILRLDLYVELYSLTRLRLAAFIWMGLVAAGLVLIVTRLVLSKSNRWLVNANLIVLAAVLYGCSIVDLDRTIAEYNVTHSREKTGRGAPLDRHYLCELGTSALPAIDTFLAGRKVERHGDFIRLDLTDCAAKLRRELADHALDWRAWTFRRYRLSSDLAM